MTEQGTSLITYAQTHNIIFLFFYLILFDIVKDIQIVFHFFKYQIFLTNL